MYEFFQLGGHLSQGPSMLTDPGRMDISGSTLTGDLSPTDQGSSPAGLNMTVTDVSASTVDTNPFNFGGMNMLAEVDIVAPWQPTYRVNYYWITGNDNKRYYMSGAKIIQMFDVSAFNYQSYQFISIVNRVPEAVIKEVQLHNPVVDGTYNNSGQNMNFPFYYDPKDDSNDLAAMTIYPGAFADLPAAAWPTNFFSATTTLVGIDNGILTPLATFQWGYTTIGGVTTLSPFSPTAVNTPSLTLGLISLYNTIKQGFIGF